MLRTIAVRGGYGDYATAYYHARRRFVDKWWSPKRQAVVWLALASALPRVFVLNDRS